jgi:gliding motility-associated-like protein
MTLQALRRIFWVSLFLIAAFPSLSSHLRSVEIRVEQLNCQTLTFKITLIAYLNSGSPVSFGGAESNLSFGDSRNIPLPEIFDVTIIDPVNNVGRSEFTIIHQYSTPGYYTIRFSEVNRNSGILNIRESGNTPFVTEARIFADHNICNSSPELLVAPVDVGCVGNAFVHNPGAIDPEGDSISYELVTPIATTEYRDPTSPMFYIDYEHASEDRLSRPTFSIDPIHGTLRWNAPQIAGEYCAAMKIVEWRLNKSDSTWFQLGYVIRDMQIIVNTCLNKRPVLLGGDDLCVAAGTMIDFSIRGIDPDEDPVIIEAFSDLFDIANPPTVSPLGKVQSTRPPNDTAAIRFVWNTTCTNVRNQAYQITFKITDQPPSGPRQVSFKTITIKVMAPPPKYQRVSINPINKSATLTWKPYDCDNTQSIQVWRRVAKYDYDQPQCDYGMKTFLRYKLIAELPPASIQFTDTNLAIGAQYCYRIVATVGSTKIQSKISLDTCIIPKPAEAPVITNASVKETNKSNGKVMISWRSPFDLDNIQYPKPWRYEVQRSFPWKKDKTTFVSVHEATIGDTTFLDGGVNTLDSIIYYRIILYVPSLTDQPVDTSSVAATVRLSGTTLPNEIKLEWVDDVPWSNNIQAKPYHYIYRNEQNINGPFVLIDSVDVNEHGFIYVDKGQYQSMPLSEDNNYYYKVSTRGSYGNPKIPAILVNDSQVLPIRTPDTKAPCPPAVTIQRPDCSLITCTTVSVRNVLQWTDSDRCNEDFLQYEIQASDSATGKYVVVGITSEKNFVHENLSDFARCYRLVAIDEAGNRSEPSETACVENCINYRLPNVFTPGNDDHQNDFFESFANEDEGCALFVIAIQFTVFNRWGGQVYDFRSTDEQGLAIRWDGRDQKGKQLPSGVYYYKANVTFKTTSERALAQEYKGWVQVIQNNQ